jgi:Flp pilus assembly protein TadG
MRRADRGSATAEMAAALPAVLVLLLTGLTGVNAVMTKLRCVDAAREAARAAARGDDGVEAARHSAPSGASITVTVEGDTVRAKVTAVSRPFGQRLPGVPVDAVAVAAVEQ